MEHLSIDRGNWVDYFNDFNKRNHSRLARLEISDDSGEHQTVKKMPLSGITFDSSGVEIMLDNRRIEEGIHYTHFVENPKVIVKDFTLDGRDDALIIVDEAGFKTKLSFEHLPELPPHVVGGGIW